MTSAKDKVRIAAMADTHCTRTSQGVFQPLFQQVSESADVLLIGGDLTDYGLPEEAQVLAKELVTAKVPVLAVPAHRGTFEGRTLGNIPVYNVSLPILRRVFPDRPPFYIFEVPAAPAEDGETDTPEIAELALRRK